MPDQTTRDAIEALRKGAPDAIDPADLPFVLEGLEQADRGEFPTETQVEAAFASFGV